MAKILLVNFDEELGARLAAVLRIQLHEVFISRPGRSFSQMRPQYGATELVILDVSAREGFVRDFLTEMAIHRSNHGPRPMILCISRVHRGPRFELDLERKGARLLYV